MLIADDHAPTRADMREAVEQDDRFVVCAEAADGAGAVEAALRERPDLCLLDIRMPGSGIAATREITTRLPDTKVVMITVSLDDEDLLNALRAGAVGYLLKDIDPTRLPHALIDALNGGAAIPRRLVARARRRVPRPRPAAPGGRHGARLRPDEPRVGGPRPAAPGTVDGADRVAAVRLARDRPQPRRRGPEEAAGAGPRGAAQPRPGLTRPDTSATNSVALTFI